MFGETKTCVRLAAVPQNLAESLALAAGIVPTPLLDTFVALLLAKTIIAAASLGIFHALESEPLTIRQIAKRCNTAPRPTAKLVLALVACKYLRRRGASFFLAPAARRWLSPASPHSLHWAVLHRQLDLRFMDFEEYVRHDKFRDFHSTLTSDDWALYHRGQADHARQIVDEIAARAPVPRGATDLLDLGGGHGLYALAFCRRHPRLHARVLDLRVADAHQPPPFDDAGRRVRFERQDIRCLSLPPASADVIVLANVVHHFASPANRDLLHRSGVALRPGGIMVLVDMFRSSPIDRAGQLEGLLDLYFGAVSGVGLWSLKKVRAWMVAAGLAPLPPVSMRRLPFWKMQIARKEA
jgi:SAM-dependent methyltransferase